MDNLRYSLLVFVLGIAPLTARAADPNAPADFTVSDTIVVPDAPRVGVNIQQPQFNNWTLDPNMEPMTLRHHGFATGGGSNFIENTGTAGTEDTSFEGAFGDGFFDGGTIRVYRSVSGAVQLLRTDTIVNYFASPTNGFRIELAGTGPTVEAGDLYFIDFAADNEPLSSVGPSVLADVTAVETWFPLNGAVLFRDNTTSAPENGGLTSLRISTPDAAFVGISQPRYGDVADFNESLEPGTVYRAEMWLRQQGLADGEVLFFLDPEYGDVMTTFTGVTGTWQKFTFDFVGPPRPNNPEFPFSHFLAFDGPGTVWVDNFYIYDPSHPVLAPMPETMEALGSFNPDTLRIWSAHTLSHLGTTLEEWTNPEALSLRSYDPFFGAVAGEADWKLPTILPIARDLGADPWFVMGPYLDESEWLGFMEYLAGPSGTPFGDKRVAQGQLAPWTDEFDAIYIEYSNEAWNPDPVFIWSMDAAIYGQLAEYFFQIAQSSPHFAAIQDKIRFIVNGFIVDTSASGFGQTAIAQGTSGDSLSVATYFLRDDGESFGGTEVTDAGFQDYLLFAPSALKFFIDGHAATRDALGSYFVSVYEGGPGFRVPDPSMPFDPAAEAYGRSLAAGVATLDLYLYATLQGFSPLNYFALRTGPNEASHTLFARDYRPHPAWQSLELRNRFASGDMLQTVTNSAPTADVAGTDDTPSMTDVPLVASYAFRDGDTYSVIVISRKFSGTTPVTLRLPFNSAETVTRHSLSGDPTATNVPALNIAPQQTAVHDFFSDVYSFSIPPSSATVFVFDGVSNAPTPDEVLVALPGETVILSLPSFLPVDDTAPDFLWTKHPDATTVLSTERELIISSAALTDAGTYVLDYNDGTGPAQYVIQLQVLAVVPALGFGGLLAGVLLLIVVAVSLRTRLGLRS